MKKQGSGHLIIELITRGHPGIIPCITGMVSRRGFNLEGILCLPFSKGNETRIFLLLRNNCSIEQIIKQMKKLRDVIKVTLCPADKDEIFRVRGF